jgi:hypothetical protein
MTFAADIVGGCSSGQAMAGGRAAARFSWELGRSAQCHQPLSRGSSWIRAFFNAAPAISPNLLHNDLLGPLTNAILCPQGLSSARAGVRRSPARPMPASSGGSHAATHFQGNFKKPAGPADVTTGSRASSAGAAARLTWGRTKRGSLSPVGTARSLIRGDSPGQRGLTQAELVRLAQSPGSGGAAAEGTRSGKPFETWYSHRRQGRAGTASSAAESIFAVSQFAPGDVAMAPPAPSAIHDWQSRMAERVRARLRSNAGGHDAVAASRSMQELWGLAIDGPAATPELLLPEIERRAAPAGHNPASPVAAAHTAVPALTRGAGRPARRELSAPMSQPAVLAKAAASPEGVATAALQVLAEELLSKAHDEPWIPSLIPSSRPRGEAPGASTPATLTKTDIAPPPADLDLGEDLSALSLRMRRVLNEEARRHGIDV